MSIMMVKSADIPTPLSIRENTLDKYVFDEIFQRKQYAIDPITLRKYIALKNAKLPKPEVILDLGANIGLSAVYFANHHLNAKIFAVEPDRENYDLLLRNIQEYPSITPILGAIWDVPENVSISNRAEIVTRSGKLNKSSYMVESGNVPGEQPIPGYPIQALMQMFDLKKIDILKIDIQGAEKRVFSGDTSWLNVTTYLFVEVHDRFVDGCFHEVAAAAKKYGFVYIGASGRDGDMLFFVKGTDI